VLVETKLEICGRVYFPLMMRSINVSSYKPDSLTLTAPAILRLPGSALALLVLVLKGIQYASRPRRIIQSFKSLKKPNIFTAYR
jgi:hypothetical protein